MFFFRFYVKLYTIIYNVNSSEKLCTTLLLLIKMRGRNLNRFNHAFYSKSVIRFYDNF